jgi:hypothetical protein
LRTTKSGDSREPDYAAFREMIAGIVRNEIIKLLSR